MDRKRCGKLIPLLCTYLSFCLLLLLFAYPSWAAPRAQSTSDQDDGQEYIVQAGDSLYKISGQFYGEPAAYTIIVEATNAKAATDQRFAPISDPRRIQAGQRLWIPNNPDQPLIVTSTVEPTTTTPTTAAPTSTVPATTTAPTATSAPSETITTTTAITPTGPSVRFVEPLDGATVPPTFTVAMTATGLLIEPAGEIHTGAGHFHILVDTDFVPAGEVIINDEQHRHYGKGQYTTTLHLDPGEHVLRLQFADGAHIAQEGPAYQDTITVTVSADSEANANADSSGPSVRFVDPIDGATVPLTFTVAMTATDLLIEPAGEIHTGAGHFHILVDTDFVPAGEVIINDEQHRHYGKGQYTTTLHLDPGEHVLRLQFADGAHIAQEGPAYQDTITVAVSADAPTAPPVTSRLTQTATGAAPSVQFVTPADGATVPAKFTVEMAATGLTVEPAGTIHAGAGHFHILVDTPFVEDGEVIISDQQHLHYGKGQITTTLELKPGQHVLRLQFANGAHIALAGDAYRDEITVTVK